MIKSEFSDANTVLHFCSNQHWHLVFWSLYWAISCSVSCLPLSSYALLPYFFFLISWMLLVLAWKQLSVRQGMIRKEYYQARNAMYSVSHLQRSSISPGSIHTITWHRIKNQQLWEEGCAAPTGPSSLVAELESIRLQERAEKSALNLATPLCCVTCSDRAWQILKRAWWHLESTVDSANMPSNQSVHDKLWNTYCENYGLCHGANLLLKPTAARSNVGTNLLLNSVLFLIQ